MNQQKFIQVSNSFTIDADYQSSFSRIGLSSIEDIFAFSAGQNLAKKNLASHRSRLQFQIGSQTFFLKRYNSPSIAVQLKNWLCCGQRQSLAYSEVRPAAKLTLAGINTPKTVCFGQTWGLFFEKRSFTITEKIPNAQSLEKKLPDCFLNPSAPDSLQKRKKFIAKLAVFTKKFHDTGFRHRDLYLCHIFLDDNQQFFLIDLARAFQPKIFSQRYRIKDLAQLYYSSPKKFFSRTDRLRFFFVYLAATQLNVKDKSSIAKIIGKANKMARHDLKHGRQAPFTN